MSKLILHSYRRCPFAIRVRMCLEEKGILYTIREESLKEASPDLLRYHPEGKVPLLVHDGFPIYESAVITEYLEDRFPSPPLRPSDPILIAQMRLWTYWCNHIFKPDLDLFKYKWAHIEDRAALLMRLNQHLNKLTEALDNKSFLQGSEFSLVDIHLFPFYRQLQKCPEFPEHFSARVLDRWLERILARPSFIRVMQRS